MTDAALGYAFAISALVLFSASILVTKMATGGMPLSLGFLISTVVNVVFAGLLFLFQLAWRTEALVWNTQAFLLFTAAGLFATYLGRWFFYESVVRFGPSKASIFQVSSPLFTALMAWLFLGERLSLLVFAGMAMAIGGLMLVSYKPGPSPTVGAGTPPAPPLAQGLIGRLQQQVLQSVLLLGLSGSLAYAVGNVLRGLAVRSWPEPILGALLGAALGLALHLGFSRDKNGLLARLRGADRTCAGLFALVGVTTIAAQMLVIAAMRYIPLSVVTLVTLCTPLFVFPVSAIVFKAKGDFNLNTLAGSALALTGIAIVVMR